MADLIEIDGREVMKFSEIENERVREAVGKALEDAPMTWVFVSTAKCEHGQRHIVSVQTGDIRFTEDAFEGMCLKAMDAYEEKVPMPDGVSDVSYDLWYVARDEIDTTVASLIVPDGAAA
jgi:hypothetical protein